MRRGQSVESTGAVPLVNYKYKEILYVCFQTQHAIQQRHIDMLTKIPRQPFLLPLDTSYVWLMIGRTDIRIKTINVGVRVMTKNMLMNPNMIGTSVEVVVNMANHSPYNGITCHSKMTCIVNVYHT